MCRVHHRNALAHRFHSGAPFWKVLPVPQHTVLRATVLDTADVPTRVCAADALFARVIVIQDRVLKHLASVPWAEVLRDVDNVVLRELVATALKGPIIFVGEVQVGMQPGVTVMRGAGVRPAGVRTADAVPP
eukprot:CAMPEP_0203954870 /NCGR_PEP_ID=MMETSP0359-20131031/87692_1 /ASSEMBLY_ACC=CAM_ASM_000338 /TAXON_ID=268821 /ORGANISM="Scrippsiella Hangoei, Strain SHTV-5" /LENGTH=131 /DNA_ID=CAMNT_0050888411 /DNA_START=58 /DNA_END=453 /DNA_ORIENTATION=-